MVSKRDSRKFMPVRPFYVKCRYKVQSLAMVTCKSSLEVEESISGNVKTRVFNRDGSHAPKPIRGLDTHHVIPKFKMAAPYGGILGYLFEAAIDFGWVYVE